ncbi:MAG: MaoC/PaaZ C-terminal domain-containing protein [Fidelibacterota bacterium]
MSKRRTITITIDKYLPIHYAGASGDFNPIHIDREFGESVGLGGNILQGLCIMGIVANRVLAESDPGKLKFLKMRFSNAVYPGDTLTLVSRQEGDVKTFVLTNQKGQEVSTHGVARFR